MLATDEWLRVKGDSSSFALGDCATIEQRKVNVGTLAILQAGELWYILGWFQCLNLLNNYLSFKGPFCHECC